LDEALRIRLGAITEIHGEAGSGKTQLLMQLSARNPHTTLYLYSESGRFPSERLVDMATTNEPQTSADNVLDRILVERRRSVLGSPAAVLRFLRGPFQKLLEQRPQLNLLILDSIAAVVRHAYDYQQRGALAKRARWMFRFVNTLRQLMRDYYPFAVVISNQVAQRADGQLVPALGFTWTQCLNTRIRLNRVAKTSDSMLSDAGKNSGSALRSANVCYSDSGPEPGTRVSFQIDHTGARGIQVFPHRQENVH
jgi:RecA/RadA recombinase